MAASLSGVFAYQAFTDGGVLASNYRLYTYIAGTTTHKDVYTEATGTTPQTYVSDGAGGQYIALNARGEVASPMFFSTGAYDLTLKTPAGATVDTYRAKGTDDNSITLDTAVRADLASTSDAAKGDALLGVKSTLTGGVARTQHAKNAERLSAEDFGAGTGVGDNTAAIQAALNAAAAAGGGVVHLGPGTFTKAGVLTMPQYVTLKGSGMRATYIENTVANVNGVNMGAGYRHGGLEDLSLKHKTGDTTNIGINFDGTLGYAHGRFMNVLIQGFNRAVSAGDELWECEFNNVRSDDALSRGFLVSGSTGASSDNLLTKCYVNNVGAGAATGKSFEFTAGMSKSVMVDCTIGDSSSTQTQLEIGTNVKGLEIVGGNAEGFTLADATAFINVGSASVVSVRGLAFQAVNGPGAGSAALFRVYDSATLNVSGCTELSAPTGTLYSLRAAGSSTARLFHSGNGFISLTDTTIPSGPQITQLLGKQTVHTLTAIDLSGAAATRFLTYQPGLYGYLVSATLIYTEASSADAGVVVSVGYVGSTSFLASVTSAINKALWDTTAMTINDRRIGGFTGPIIVTCGGGKVGTGEVLVLLEYTTV